MLHNVIHVVVMLLLRLDESSISDKYHFQKLLFALIGVSLFKYRLRKFKMSSEVFVTS